MLSFSKTTGVIALAGMICSMQAVNFDKNTGMAFVLIGGQFVEKVPVVNTVNEKISDVTGVATGDLQTAELALVALTAATQTNNMTTDQAKRCVQAGAEGLAAHEALKRLHNVEAVNSWLPAEGSWADKLTWGLLTALIHSVVESGKTKINTSRP